MIHHITCNLFLTNTGMDIINQTIPVEPNTTHGSHPTTTDAAIGIAHFIIVVIPSALISATVLFYLCKLMKTSGARPVLIMYSIIAILCITGPSVFAILNLITIFQSNGISCMLASFYYVVVFGTAMVSSYCTAIVAAAQFLVLQAHQRKLITSKNIIIFFFLTLFITEALNAFLASLDCILNVGEYVTATVWIIIAFVVPLLITIVFSVLTCLKVRNGVFEDTKVVIRSVVTVNAINLLCYIVFRFCGIVVFFAGVSLSDTYVTLAIWKEASFSISNIGYPLTALSILVLHSKIQKMAFNCKMNTEYHDEKVICSTNAAAISAV